MKVYYRFQHEKPTPGEEVHCFTTLEGLKEFARMMQHQDPDFRRMKFWEISGSFVQADDGDAIVRVSSATEIRL